ncbi:MAG: excinuclease ABC subunit UvrC [Candidatus Saccharimonadales bacterium]
MNKRVQTKLTKLPKSPGVYFHKDASGEIIYVGKASSLRTRVRSYFQSNRAHDFKTQALVNEIADIEWLEVGSEVEALFLESAMIKRYMPKYNILLRDDKNFLYVKISGDVYPRVSFTRRPLDDDATYFGPFTSAFAVRRAMKQLRRSFPYVTHRTLPRRACLHYHLGLCPGPEIEAISPEDYRRNIQQLKRYLAGKVSMVTKELEREMKRQSRAHNFEIAARVRDQLHNLQALQKQHLFGREELFDLGRDRALLDLQSLLKLDKPPRRLECYDISHLQGTNNVASMVVFTDGVPNRGEYRKFKLRLQGNDDFAHMQEVLQRRARHWDSWPQPDVIIIDGGKGQVRVVVETLESLGIHVPVIGLAKRFERIIMPQGAGKQCRYEEIVLQQSSHLLKLIMHIRDEAHRFAVTYHSLLRNKAQTASVLETVPGVGPATRKKLIRQFGSYRGVKAASEAELAATVGAKLAKSLKEQL